MPSFDSYTTVAENVLIVTHAVPIQRIRPEVPEALELDAIKGPEGEDFALVSTRFFLNRDLRWSPSGEESLDFHQCFSETYVRSNEETGVYVLACFLERETPLVFERLAMKNAYAADFDVSLAYDPTERAYQHYYTELLSSKGDTAIEVSSAGHEPSARTPFESGQEMSRYITDRHILYFAMIGGGLGAMRLEFGEMNPIEGDLLSGEFGYWEDLGVLREEEFEKPYSVLLQPAIEVIVHAPEMN
jgi:hypothetical protein